MSLRQKTALILFVATIFNVFLLYFYFLAFQSVLGLFLPNRPGWWALGTWWLLAAASLAAAWFTNRLLYRFLCERYPLDRWIDVEIFRNLFSNDRPQ